MVPCGHLGTEKGKEISLDEVVVELELKSVSLWSAGNPERQGLGREEQV